MSSGTQPPHYDSDVDFLNFLFTGQSSRICKNDPAAALRGHRESGNFKFSGLLLIHLYLHGWQGWPSGEHLPSTNVAQVRFLHSVSYLDWVCWFSILL